MYKLYLLPCKVYYSSQEFFNNVQHLYSFCTLFFNPYAISPVLLFFFKLYFRSFCSCLIEPVSGSPELRDLVEVNLEFQVQFIYH